MKLADIGTIDQHLALGGLVKSHDEPTDGRFARADAADDRDFFTRRNLERDIVEHPRARTGVVEDHVLEGDAAFQPLAARLDPMAFRKTLLAGDARSLAVLNAVDTLSGWSKTAPPAGTGRGVAFMSGFGSYVAMVAHVTKDSAGKLKVTKVFCAIDCGVAINPDSIEAQIQGGIIYGLSAALWGEVTFANGVANVRNFSNYRVLTLKEIPVISVKVVASTAAPGGVGETGVPCVAPAVANAYAKLSGKRLRTLPFYPGATMSD